MRRSRKAEYLLKSSLEDTLERMTDHVEVSPSAMTR
jgi:hypothetical protein